MSTQTKIHFRIAQDQEGYPPVAVESLWAKPIGTNFEIDSIPFFTCDATVGDIIRAAPDAAGELWFAGMEQVSVRSLIRIVFFEAECTESVTNKLQALGCGTEGMEVYKLLAVDVPGDVDLVEVQNFLRDEASTGSIDYEEPLLRH